MATESNTTYIPASVSNVIALDAKRRLEYPITMDITGRTVTLKNASGQIIATGTTQDTTYSEATTAKSGLMSASDKTKLTNLENYTLPQATDTTLGGVMITQSTTSDSTTAVLSAAAGAAIMAAAKASGHTLTLTGTTLTLNNADGNTISTVTIPDTYKLPQATASTLGGVKIGSGINVATDGTISVTLPTNPLQLRGKIESKDSLPSSGMEVGDMYLVGTQSPYIEYAWTGQEWEVIGTFDDSLKAEDLVFKSDFLSDDEFLALFE